MKGSMCAKNKVFAYKSDNKTNSSKHILYKLFEEKIMRNINKITNEDRNAKDMREKKILIEVAGILLQEKLINIDEKIRLEKVIQKGNL